VDYIYCSSVSVSPEEVPCLENSTAAYIEMAITEAVNAQIGPELLIILYYNQRKKYYININE